MRESYLPFSLPAIAEDEINEVVDTLRSSWITTGPKTRRFENAFALRVSAPDALAVNSCTAALHTALLASGVGPGDEVITTPMTFAASVNVIEHVGARPVLVDVEPDTLNIDPRAVEHAVTERTRAVVAVHYAGHPAELDPLVDTCTRHGLILIEDAAHAFPAAYRGRSIGSADNPAAFSFYATKNLTTAEGGMLTASTEFLGPARALALHGMSRDAWKRYDKGASWKYDIVAPGFKYNMTDIQASLGLVQLQRMTRFQCRREAIVTNYNAAFGPQEALITPVQRPHVQHAWHLYTLRIRTECLRIDRDAFIAEMTARNIGTSVHFIPIHLHSYYRDKYGFQAEAFPIALEAFNGLVSLPLHPGLSDDDVEDVTAAVLDIVEQFSR